jgi:putative nucleotidyltransferase with HDIG domain
MATTVEIRDPYAAGHQKRVADLARTIAIHLKLPKNKINGLYMAALIHDIGKISVPFEILSKPGKLTNIEYEFFKMHPKTAYRILRDIDFPWPIADIILQHHERLNGSGYPYGLKGDEIMTEAKILGVADMIEAMVTPRIYRSSYLSIEDALNEIQNQKGILYDSDVVDACEYILTENVWQF